MAWQRSTLLMLAMTLHNFPEGLAVGVSYGAENYGAATALAIGIGLQNIPEGLAIALPLRAAGMSRGRAFFWGQLSAAVEPFAGASSAPPWFSPRVRSCRTEWRLPLVRCFTSSSRS